MFVFFVFPPYSVVRPATYPASLRMISSSPAPKGYAKDHPAIEYLKLKSFVVVAELSDKEVQSKNFRKTVKEIFKAMLPLNEFLRRALD